MLPPSRMNTCCRCKKAVTGCLSISSVSSIFCFAMVNYCQFLRFLNPIHHQKASGAVKIKKLKKRRSGKSLREHGITKDKDQLHDDLISKEGYAREEDKI